MLPYGKQSIDEDDIAAVVDVLRSDFLTTGPKVSEFEDALCELTGAKYAIACSSATTALHLSSLSLGLGKGDVAIVPSLTFLATANAVRYTGADVLFSDVNPDTGLMEAEHLEELLEQNKTANIKAVFPVHLTGQCVDSDAISAVAKKHGISVVLDSAHALGSVYKNKVVGAGIDEDLSVFSFHPVKMVAMGEGGAVTTNNEALAKKIRSLRSHGMVPKPDQGAWFYEMSELGYNYRITDIQCALGLSQLKKLDSFISRRQELVSLYDELLEPLSPIIKSSVKISDCNPGWHLYSVRIDFEKLEKNRADLMGALKEKGVGTQVHYIPVHHQPYYKALYGDIDLPGADHYYEHTLSLPLFPAMTDDDVRHVVKSLSDIVKGVQ